MYVNSLIYTDALQLYLYGDPFSNQKYANMEFSFEGSKLTSQWTQLSKNNPNPNFDEYEQTLCFHFLALFVSSL